MNLSLLGLSAAVAYSLACMAYVYRWRGRLRYAGLSQYLRKSWPIFAPLNCLMYLGTQAWARRPVLDAGYLHNIELLREHWPTMRDEALALQRDGVFEAVKAPGAAGFYDLGFRTFFKRGWSKFYLSWYGQAHPSAQRLCPQTVALLAQVPGIRGAMFSILPAGAELSLHADPMACSLRYHLGLATPNSERCQIQVDDQACTWFDGRDFVFDETYPHSARNASNEPRLILLCDVDRPLNGFGRVVHALYLRIARATRVPNTAEDGRGLFSALFMRLAPLRQKSLGFRQRQPRAYQALKLLLNSSLLAACAAILYALLQGIEALVG